MIRLKLLQLTLIAWCCVLYDKAIVEGAIDKDLVNGLVLEALELENNFAELEKSTNVTALYHSLINKVQSVRGSKDNDRALLQLIATLRYQLKDKEDEPSIILDLESYAGLVGVNIELRNREIPAITNILDADVANNLNQLRRTAIGNFALHQYRHYIAGFQLTYFPYAVCYLESLQIPTTPTAYDNLDAIISTITDHLNETVRHIEDIKSKARDVEYLEGNKPEDAFYIWKNADIRDKIPRLFKGEKIILEADVKTATNHHNALKFNKLDFIFRSSNQTVHNQLSDAVKSYQIQLNNNGRSAFRYNDHFYQLDSMPLKMFFNFEKDNRGVPLHRNSVYSKLRDSRPVMSPYTEWELQLIDLVNDVRFETLAPLDQLDIDIELHGSGSYVADDLQLCEEEKLSTFYTRMQS